MTSTTRNYGTLTDADTGEALRPADEEEWRLSGKLAALPNGGRGVFCYGAQHVYVAGGDAWAAELPDAQPVDFRPCLADGRHHITQRHTSYECPAEVDDAEPAGETIPAAYRSGVGYAEWRIRQAQREMAGIAGSERDGLRRVAQGKRERAARHLRLAAEAMLNGAPAMGPAVAAAVRATVQRRCEANSRRGTGTGMCDAPLDAHGQCPRAGAHLEG